MGTRKLNLLGAGKGTDMSTITTAEAAELAGIQPQTIRRYCRQGRFECWRWEASVKKLLCSTGTDWQIDKRSFLAWLKLPRKVGGYRRKAT